MREDKLAAMMEGEGEVGNSVLSALPPVVLGHQLSKDDTKQLLSQEHKQQDDIISPVASTISSGEVVEAQHSASLVGGRPTPRMLRFFITFSITWSATITSCLGPYFPLYVKANFDASSMLIGVIFSMPSIVQFITCPMVSPLSRTFSRLFTLRVGLVVLTAGTLLFGFLDSIPGFVLGRLLQGIGNGFLEVSGLSLLMRFSTDLRRDIGLLEGASSLGFLLGPLIGGFLSARLGFRELFVFMSLPVLCMVVLLWTRPQWVLPPEHSSQGPARGGESDGEEEGEEVDDVGVEEGYEPMQDGDGVELEMQTVRHAEAAAAAAAAAVETAENLRGARNLSSACAPQPSPLAPPSPTHPRPLVTPYESFASTTRKLLRALAASPTLPLYMAIILVVSGGLSFMDTALAEHIVAATGVSAYIAGLLFTLQVGVYIVFAFFAAELAHRLGEWRVIVSCAGLWSIAMLALGPFPPLAPYFVAATAGAGTDGGGLGLIVSSLVVLGITETFVFLPFIPLFHRRLQRKLGWAALETEDTVASVWTTTWACGHTLGPLVGGLLLDTLPRTPALSCLSANARAAGGTDDASLDDAACQSAFAWAAALWGFTGLLLALLLVFALVRARMRRAWRRRMARRRPVYSAEAALGELPLPGAAGHEDMYCLDEESEGEGEEGRENRGERMAGGILACAAHAAVPKRPLLSMPSFFATEEYELDRSMRGLDASRRGLDASTRALEMDGSMRGLDGSRRGGGGHMIPGHGGQRLMPRERVIGELDRSSRSEMAGEEEGERA
ncbi:hypothetical protein VYU27_008909 [Nannochloropsis oceanica]